LARFFFDRVLLAVLRLFSNCRPLHRLAVLIFRPQASTVSVALGSEPYSCSILLITLFIYLIVVSIFI
jgi:hypothetical protein